MRGPYSGGVTGDLEGIDCGEEEATSGNNSAASVTRERLLANLTKMASRGARTFVDNLDKRKVLSSDCTNLFATLNRDLDAYFKGAASVGSGGGFPGQATRQCQPLRVVERAGFMTALRTTRQRWLELGLQNNPPWTCARC